MDIDDNTFWNQMLKEPEDFISRAKMHWRRFSNGCSKVYYEVRGFFLPYNVIKVHNSPRTWSDRDDFLFHTMFQILVDFIEYEQPYCSWNGRVKGRLSDVHKHREGMEQRYNPALQTHTEDSPGDRYYQVSYPSNRRIIELYEWYKSRAWEDRHFEDYEEEKALIADINAKMCEVVSLRGHFWT